MAFQIRTAERKKAKLKLGVSGPSGAGKTYSSLLLAFGIVGDWSKVTLIDTENGSGELYSSLGKYNVIPFEPPFSPVRYIEAIQFAVKSGAQVVVIDSISHEWDGKGGCLEMQSALGGKYQDWARVTPLHNNFIAAILQAPVHVIVTTRKKQDYDLSKGSDGKTKVQKVGLKEIQRDGFEYELTINFDVDTSHYAVTSKDRTGVFAPRGPFQISSDTGLELAIWADGGAHEEEQKKPATQPNSAKPSSTLSVISSAALSDTSPVKDGPPTSSTTSTTTTGLGTAIPAPQASQEPPRTEWNSKPGLITQDQGKRLWAVAREHGWEKDQLKGYLTVAHGLNSIKLIPLAIFNDILRHMKDNALKGTSNEPNA